MWVLREFTGGVVEVPDCTAALDLFKKAEVKLKKKQGCLYYFLQGYWIAYTIKLQRGWIEWGKSDIYHWKLNFNFAKTSLINFFFLLLNCTRNKLPFKSCSASFAANYSRALLYCGLTTSLPVCTHGCLWLCKATKPLSTIYLHNNRHFFTLVWPLWTTRARLQADVIIYDIPSETTLSSEDTSECFRLVRLIRLKWLTDSRDSVLLKEPINLCSRFTTQNSLTRMLPLCVCIVDQSNVWTRLLISRFLFSCYDYD